MILGKSLFNDRGDCLAAAGVELHTRLIHQLRTRGYMSLPHDQVMKTMRDMSGSQLNAQILHYFMSVTPFRRGWR